MRRTSKNSRRTGYSVLELMIALGILGLVSGSIALVGQRGQAAANEVGATSELRAKTHRSVVRIADELKSIGAGSMVPNPGLLGVNNLSYQRIEDIQGAAITWSNTRRVRWERDPAEANNGLDDDQDGYADEGQIVLVRDEGLATEQWQVVCRNVPEFMPGELPNGIDDNGNGLDDEPALLFRRDTNLLTVTLGLEQLLTDGRRIQSTTTTAILLRN